MIPGRLRLRFVVAAGLLVLTTVVASVWTFFSLSRLSGVVTDTVRQSESVTAVTSRLAGALEREDDAVLLILAGDARGTEVLARERAVVDKAVTDLVGVLEPDDERELAQPLQTELALYRRASDGVVAVVRRTGSAGAVSPEGEPVASARCRADDRDPRSSFRDSPEQAIAGARDEAAAARRAVLVITLIALGIAVAVAWHLTHTVVGPLRRLTRGANAIREGRFFGANRRGVPRRARRAGVGLQPDGGRPGGVPADECQRGAAREEHARSDAGSVAGCRRVAGCGWATSSQ